MSQPDVEDAYPLSPTQEGLLFHALQAPGQGTYVTQYTCVVRDLVPEHLVAAWRLVVDRHPILRTAFAWKSTARPLQVVGRPGAVGLTPEREAWEGLTAAEQEARLGALLEADGRHGFNVHRAPLMRLAVIGLGGGSHRLVWTFHHLILDGWSRNIVLSEVLTLYASLRAGRGEGEVSPRRPFRDYIAWLQRQDLASCERFWRQVLGGFTAATPLGVDRPAWPPAAPAELPEVPASQAIELPEPVTSALRALARQNRLTLSSVVQGAWALLLSHYSGRLDLIYGAVVSGRPAEVEGVEAMVGMFINTLPLRVRLRPAEPLLPWLERLQQQLADLRQYEYSPLVEVQKWSDVARGAPLFESVLAFENFPQEPSLPGGQELLDVRWIQRSSYPLAAAVQPGPRLRLCLAYSRRRFDDAAVARALGHLEALFTAMAAAPESCLEALPLLPAAERRQVLAAASAGQAPGGVERCLPELFAAQAAGAPAAAAVCAAECSWTYGELDARANRLARYLRRLGIGPEASVAILLERSPASLVAVLAVWKAGAAYVPLAAGLPAARAEFQLGDSGAVALLTESRLAAGAPAGARSASPPRQVLLDRDAARIAAESGEPLPPAALPENLAYVIYTSGSTGQPKGVAVEHRQLAHYVAAIVERLEIAPGAAFASVSSLAADLGNTTLFAALATGGCLHLPSEDEVRDGDRLGEYCRGHGIDYLKIVPSHLAALLSCSHPERLLPRRMLILGGEPADPRLLARLQALRALQPLRPPSGPWQLWNHYGPTETTIGITAHRAAEGGGEGGPAAGGLPLGSPLGGNRIYLVDAYGQLAAAGAPAEIWVAGPGLARGYLGRPRETAERFSPDALSVAPGERVYRTGDLARRGPDGVIEFLGRADHQVKVRGFRIELREIEAALERHPDVAAAVVAAGEDAAGNRRLWAYVEPRRRATGLPHLLPSGLPVFHLSRNETEHLYRQIFEDGIYLRHGIALPDEARILDVGANIGLFTLFAHCVCERPRVLAFEPSPPAFEQLCRNAELYGLAVELEACAISDREGTAPFTIYPRASVMSGLYADRAEEERLFRAFVAEQQRQGADPELLPRVDELAAGRFAVQVVERPLRTISSVLRERAIEWVDLLKVDAEKSEMDVFSGIAPEDWPKIQQVTAEVHDVDGRLAAVVSLLEGQGFTVAVEQDSSLRTTGIHHVYARRPRPAVGDGWHDRPWRQPSPRALPAAAPASAEPLREPALRELLRRELPDYMMPAGFTLLDALPRLPNGKIDRAGLPEPGAAPQRPAGAAAVAPRNEVEAQLAKIWSEVLRVEPIGVHDNFFQLGGDSILNIQIVARAHRAGLRLSPSQLFQHPTIAELAAVAAPVAASAPAAAPVSGPVPLTPIQAWFFELGLADPHHFNMPLLLEVRSPLAPRLLAAAWRQLLAHHDGLRLGFVRQGPAWRQWNAAPGENAPLVVIGLQGLPAAAAAGVVESAGGQLQASFALARPPLVRAGLFLRGGREPDLLLLAVHHLVIDGVSWRVLIEDLQAACRALARGEAVRLPDKTTSFKSWAEALARHARAGGFAGEASYWAGMDEPEVPLRVDLPAGGNRVSSGRARQVSLDAATTRQLIEEVPPVYGTEINDVLAAAVVRAFGEWSGEGRLLIDLEGHGREEVLEGVDLTRTVGWFTTHFPVLLQAVPGEPPGETLKRVKETLRRIPGRGIGYGALRYLAGDPALAAALRAKPRPQVKLNYLGRLDRVLPRDALFAPCWDRGGEARSPRGQRSHLLEISAAIREGSLEVSFGYAADVHRAASIDQLAGAFMRALSELIAHCRTPGAGGYTPADFPDAKLDQHSLDAVIARVGGRHGARVD